MQMGMHAIFVRHNDRLMLIQLQLAEDLVCDAFHRWTVHAITRIEAQGYVIDWLRHTHIPRGGGPHNLRR
jgi:hypothetical protein